MHSHDAEYRESGNGWATKPNTTAAADADVYRERAHLIAHLAAIYPAVLQHGADPAEPGWPVLYIELPTGQASWHISPDDLDLLEHVPAGAATWDGHDTAEKYRRLDQATANVAASHDQTFAMDGDEWVSCSGPHCPNAERFAKATERSWQASHMGTWQCPNCAAKRGQDVDFPPLGGHDALCAHAAGIGPRCTCNPTTQES